MSTNAISCSQHTLEFTVMHMENLSAVPESDWEFGDLLLVTTAMLLQAGKGKLLSL